MSSAWHVAQMLSPRSAPCPNTAVLTAQGCTTSLHALNIMQVPGQCAGVAVPPGLRHVLNKQLGS